MKKSLILCMLLLLPLFGVGLEEIKVDLQGRIDTITSHLENTTLKASERNEAILTTVESLLDFELMSKLSLAQNARAKLSEAQLKSFNTLFEKELKDSFLHKLESYSNEKIELKNLQQTSPTRLSLFSLLKGKKEDMEIVFKYYLSKEQGWKIYDLEIAGVSLIQTYRTQFTEIVTAQGPEALLQKLRTKS